MVYMPRCRMRLKGVLCRGIDRAVGPEGRMPQDLQAFIFLAMTRRIRWAPHRIVDTIHQRKKPVVPYIQS